MLRLGYDVITDAMVADEVYVPGKGSTGRADNWNQWSRWRRVCISFVPYHLLMCSTIRAFLAEGGISNCSTFCCPLEVWLWRAWVGVPAKEYVIN